MTNKWLVAEPGAAQPCGVRAQDELQGLALEPVRQQAAREKDNLLVGNAVLGNLGGFVG